MSTVPRLPLLGDPLRRMHVPSDLASITTVGAEEDPGAVGLNRRVIERIWSSARDLYRSGVHPAVQLCLRRHGRVVLDRSIGHARGNGPDDPRDAEKVLVTPDTPYCVFSTSKAITATVIHLLDEQGALDIHERITEYVPSYGRHGKEETTIAHVLAHRAGVPTLPRKLLDIERVGGQPVEKVVELSNDPRFLTSVVPSGNVVTTANELSRFFEIFRAGGILDGVRIMQPETIHRALEEQSRLEFDLSLGFPTRFSYGLMLGPRSSACTVATPIWRSATSASSTSWAGPTPSAGSPAA
jgi:Beta-lactamase